MKYFQSVYIGIVFMILLPTVVEAQNARRQKGNTEVQHDPERSAYYFIEAQKYFILEDFAKAYVLFQKAIEYDQYNAAAHYKLAEILMETDEFEKALLHAQKALELDPENKYYHLINAEIYTRQSNFSTAAAIYKNMLSTIDGTEAYLFDLAALYLYENDLNSALATYDQAEQEFGIGPEIVMQKQKIYLKLNKLDEAIAEGEKLIKAHPDREEFSLQLAEMLISNNRHSQAASHLNKLVAANPQNAHARLLLAEVYKNSNQIKESNENLRIAFESTDIDLEPKLQMMANYISKLPDERNAQLAIDLSRSIIKAHPDDADAYAISGDLYYTLRQQEKAIDFYLQSLAIEKSNFNIWQNVLDLELRLNKLDSVIKHSDEALIYFPNQAALYYFNGTAHSLKENYKEAASALERGKRLSSGNLHLKSVFSGQLGDIYNSLEDYRRSDASYEEALELDPSNSHVLNNYAYFLSLRKENLEKAKTMSTRLIQMHPDDPTFLDTHAWVLYTLKEYEEARRFLEKAIGKTDSGTIIEHYGDVLFQLGETEKAVEQWKKAKGMDDTSEMIDKKIADRKLYE